MIIIKFEENQSVAYDDDDKKIGECDFIEENDTWNIIHTEVDNTYQGQGIAKKLVECVIENAKKHKQEYYCRLLICKKGLGEPKFAIN